MIRDFARTLIIAGLFYFALSMSSFAKTPSHFDFAMKETADMMVLGPEGKRLAYVQREFVRICRSGRLERLPAESCAASQRRLAPEETVIVLDVDTMAVVKNIKMPDDSDVNWLEWTSSNNLLISATTAWKISNRHMSFPIGRILSVKMDGSSPIVPMFGEEQSLIKNNRSLSRVVNMLRNDPDHIIMGARRNNDHDLFKVNVNDGSATRVAKGKKRTKLWFTDINGSPSIRMDCTSDSCKTVEAYRPADGADPNDEDADWIMFRTLSQKRRADEEFMELTLVAPSDDPFRYYVITQGEGDERRSIKVFDIRTNEFIKTVFSDPVHDVSGGYVDPETGQYAGAQIWRDRVEYEFLDSVLTEHWTVINAYFGDVFNVTLTGFSEDGRVAVVYASAPNHPGGYYLYDFESRSVDFIIATHKALPDELDSTTDILAIPTRDGQSITGYHTKPGEKSLPTEGNPLVLLIHGGPESRDVYDYDRDVQFLASRGYQVLRVNFRGSDGYGRDFAEAGYRQWGGVMHTDIIDAARFMVAEGATTRERTCVMGHSYGGYAALLAGALSPDDFSCVIAGAGPSDLNESLKYERITHGHKSSNVEYWDEVIGDRKADKSKLAKISPANLADRYDDPILLIHGLRDRIVPVSQSEDMHKALEAVGADVRTYYPNEGHYHRHWRIESSVRYFGELERFLSKSMDAVTASENTR